MNTLIAETAGWGAAILLVVWAAHRALACSVWWKRQGRMSKVGIVWLAGAAGCAVLLSLLGLPWSLMACAVWLWLLFGFGARSGNGELDWKQRKAWHEVQRQAWLHLALLAGSTIFMLPFLWLLSTSLKWDDQMRAFPPQFIPTRQVTVQVDGHARPVYELEIAGAMQQVYISRTEPGRRVHVQPVHVSDPARAVVVSRDDLEEVRRVRPRWENYSEALEFLPPEYLHGLVPLWNTIYITILTITGMLLSSSMAAYSFSRIRWPGREIFFIILLATMMLPAAVTMLPVFLIFRWLGWIDTLRPLWVPAFLGSAFHIFLLRQFFMTIPMELEEAAKIDGCNPFTTYWRIMLPLVKPALAAVTIMAFMGSWNNFMGPLIYINSPEKMPLSYALYLFQGMHGGEQGMLMAASTMVMLPVLLVFFFTQRYFIQGITLTGMKG